MQTEPYREAKASPMEAKGKGHGDDKDSDLECSRQQNMNRVSTICRTLLWSQMHTPLYEAKQGRDVPWRANIALIAGLEQSWGSPGQPLDFLAYWQAEADRCARAETARLRAKNAKSWKQWVQDKAEGGAAALHRYVRPTIPWAPVAAVPTVSKDIAKLAHP